MRDNHSPEFSIGTGWKNVYRESLSSPAFEGRKEMKYLAQDGIERWFLVFAVPLLAADDTASQDESLLVLNDITEQRQQQERLQAHSGLASVGELASGVAHEINNPLAAIYGLSELLQMEELPPEADVYNRKIQDAVQRAAKVVQNLLSFARNSEPEKQYLEVTSVVDRALELKLHDLNIENIRVITSLFGARAVHHGGRTSNNTGDSEHINQR